MRPSFVFEHLEHGDVFGIEGISFNGLKIHGFQAALPGSATSALLNRFVLSTMSQFYPIGLNRSQQFALAFA